ncbi:MAG: hypothetical protein NTX11_02845 [Candidatus Saccharibacteria bacterium]|nr:hypothetical protein [Candidatus Saccharibacteria bacterium]
MEKEMTIQEAGKELARRRIEVGPDDPRSPLEILAAHTAPNIGQVALVAPLEVVTSTERQPRGDVPYFVK